MMPEHLRGLCEKGETGDADAAFAVAEYYYGRREYEQAYLWYEKASLGENPNPVVYFNLGYACQMGEGTQVDLISAYDYYEKAAAKHLPQALYQLAYFYQNGLVVRQDFQRARLCSRQAAKELAELVTRVHEAEIREEEAVKRSMEILRGLEQMNSKWRGLAQENGRLREQLAETKVREQGWRMDAEKWERKATLLEYENRNMKELLMQAQAELEKRNI